jgi:hypothetical protein
MAVDQVSVSNAAIIVCPREALVIAPRVIKMCIHPIFVSERIYPLQFSNFVEASSQSTEGCGKSFSRVRSEVAVADCFKVGKNTAKSGVVVGTSDWRAACVRCFGGFKALH